MGKFKAFMMRLMYGRYGVDKLYHGLFILFLIIAVVNLFVSWLPLRITLSLLNTLIFIIMFYRVFSKQIYKRRQEEALYLTVIAKVKKPFSVAIRRFKERKTHVYKKCPKCKAQLRFPRKKGTILVNCPKCREQFKVKI